MNCERDEELLTRGLRALAEEMETLGAPDELEMKLREAFRTRAVVVPIARKQLNSRYWLVAIAAMLLIAISLVVVRWRASDVNGPRQTVAQGAPQNKPEVTNRATEEPVVYQAVNVPVKHPVRKPVRRAASRRPENTQVANHATNEIATDFIPL